jgi:hypothetical protein
VGRGGYLPGSRDQRSDDLHVATSGPHRPGYRGGADDRGEGGAAGLETDPRARSRAGGPSPGHRVPQGAGPPKGRFAAIAVMVAEGLPAPQVSESGFYAWRTRSPSPRMLRHAWLTEMINQIHVDFRGVPGSPGACRAHAGPRHHRRCRGSVVADAQRRPARHVRSDASASSRPRSMGRRDFRTTWPVADHALIDALKRVVVRRQR